MIGAPNSLNLNCKVRVMKEVPGPSVPEKIADIFRNYNIDDKSVGWNYLSIPKLQSATLKWYITGSQHFNPGARNSKQ